MVMKNRFFGLLGMAAVALGVTGTAAADWTRTYVVDWYEPASYYGAKTGTMDPGADCPAGTIGEPDWVKVLMKAGYTQQEAKWLRDPVHPYRVPSNGQNQMAFRGKDRANIYTQPWLTPDPGMAEVTGSIGEGLDLDGDKTNGFLSPTGETGVDNQFYKAMGCWKAFRGPTRLAMSPQSRNDLMREGEWTVLIVVSGKGADPMNDPNVRVGIYDSKDALVKDGNGEIAPDYTFHIAPSQHYEGVLEAKTVNGVIVSTKPTDEMWMREPTYAREVQLLQAQLKLEMKADGTLKGLVAGYRPWMASYQGWVDGRGSVVEQLFWIELPAVYYALKRNADYSPAVANGEKTHISFAMRVNAIPAFVMMPDGKKQVSSVDSYKSIAPPFEGKMPVFTGLSKRIVDGLVKDSNGQILAGPKAVIGPPPAS